MPSLERCCQKVKESKRSQPFPASRIHCKAVELAYNVSSTFLQGQGFNSYRK